MDVTTIPNGIKVGPHTYVVKEADPLLDGGGNTCHGRFMRFDGEILLDTQNMAHPTEGLDTFLHELLHAMNHSFRVKLDHEQIYLLATGLTSVVVDNGWDISGGAKL